VVVVSAAALLWPLRAAHGQGAPVPEPSGLVPHAIALGDFDRDGIPDVVVPAAAERKVTVLLSDGRGGFKANQSYPTGRGPTWVEIGDWSGDGHLDLVVANVGEGSLTPYLGDGAGGFTRAPDVNGFQGPR
jgi:hypothetical protein